MLYLNYGFKHDPHNYSIYLRANMYNLQDVNLRAYSKMNNGTCYERLNEWSLTLQTAMYWIESITIPFVGSLGCLGNILVITVLIRFTNSQGENKNRNNFDKLLISLAIVDTLHLIMYVTDSFVQANGTDEPYWYQVCLKLLMTTLYRYR